MLNFKKILGIALTLFLCAMSVSCGSSLAKKAKLCDGAWVSSVDILEFTESGKVLHNFESESDSVSYYKLKDDKITLFTEEGEKFGMTFDISVDEDVMILGTVEYKRYKPEENQGEDESDEDDENKESSEEEN